MKGVKQALAFPGSARGLPAWRRKLRAKLVDLMGYDHMPAKRGSLKVRSLWKREHHSGLGVVEKIVFTAEPGVDVPAYVCLPRETRLPGTWMICLQGHTTGMHHSIAAERSDETTPMPPAGDRDFAVQCMRH